MKTKSILICTLLLGLFLSNSQSVFALTTTPSSCDSNISKSKTASASGCTNASENASMAVDGNSNTKWCDNSSTEKWLEVDLGDTYSICRWKVIHAGIETSDYITKAFKLQYQDGTNWIDADVVTDNTSNETDKTITPVSARYVRLYINQGTQYSASNTARIYEFQVYSSVSPTSIEEIEDNTSNIPTLKIFPNPIVSQSLNVELSGFSNEKEVVVTIVDVNGKRVYNSNVNIVSMSKLNIDLKSRINEGTYVIMVKGKCKEAKGWFIVSPAVSR